MNRYLLYGIAAFLFLGGLVAAFDRSQINQLRQMAGFEPLYRSEALGIGDAEEAVDQTAALPAPGIVGDPPTLGELADATVECYADTGVQPVSAAVSGALRRYLLALAATGLAREHPLIEPGLQPLYGLTGQGPMAVLETVRDGRLTSRQESLLAAFHETYRDPDHPLYGGLEIFSGTMAGLNFTKAADGLASRWDETADCTVAQTLPPLAEWERLAVE